MRTKSKPTLRVLLGLVCKMKMVRVAQHLPRWSLERLLLVRHMLRSNLSNSWSSQSAGTSIALNLPV